MCKEESLDFDRCRIEEPCDAVPVADLKVVVSTNAPAILPLGVYPGALLRLCQAVIEP